MSKTEKKTTILQESVFCCYNEGLLIFRSFPILIQVNIFLFSI